MTRQSVIFIVWAIVLVVTIGACGSSTGEPIVREGLVFENDIPSRRDHDNLEGKPAPPLVLSNWMNTTPLALSDLRGKVVLLDFWGVWCPPCRAFVPHVKALHERYGTDGLVVIGVHTKQSAEDGPAFVEAQGIPYAVGFDLDDETVKAYHVQGFPDVFLIDRAGVLRYADLAQGVEGNVEKAVERLLAE